MKRRVFKFISSVLLIFTSIMTLTSCSTEKTAINEFSADETYFVCGEVSSVTFSAEVTGNAKEVILYAADNEKIGEMTDDGHNGDKIADDGIYSYTIDIKKDEASQIQYYAKVLNIKSDVVTLYFFVKPTEESRNSVIDFQEEASDIEERFVDEDGFVEYDEVPQIISLVGEYAEELYNSGKLISYEITENSVILKWKSGLTSVYSPDVKDTYGIKNESEITVSAYQPYFDWVSTLDNEYIPLPSDADNEAMLLEMAANEISDLLKKTSVEIYRDAEVSLSSIKSLKNNQIVLWQGHGVYGGPELHSLICTGNSFDWDAWFWDYNYFMDCCKERIVEYGGSETFSYKYIDAYCPNIDNAVVYLGPCQSGYDSTLADSFLGKGATAVIANTETILCLYGDMVQYTTMHLLTQINSDTKDYYTLSEALLESKRLYGTSDAQYGGVGAEPIIFGGEKAENYRLGNYVPITVNDFTIPNDFVITLGELGVIEPELNPLNADEYSIKWSSSDESVATVSPNGEAGIITTLAKGTTTITAELTSGGKTITKTTNLRVASKARDTVLVLDVSGSMYGDPLDEMKKSAIQFCNDLLKDEYNNRVGIVFYDDGISTIALTDDLNMLVSRIQSISDGGRTNMEAGLSAADKMLKNSGKSESIKNVVVMADGLPNEGKTSYSGSMPSGNYSGYYTSVSYANAVIDTAKQMMNNYNLYSLGFFHGLYSDEKDFATTLMKELTNQADGYHQVDKAEDLQFAFGDISEDINVGSKIVINIACPVDVRVTHNGETLSSAESTYCDMTSFGTLQLLGKNRDIKVLSLDSDKEYEVELTGIGIGKMDYSVSYFNDNEQLSDYRSFEAVPITMTTVITSDTNNTEENVSLNIDNDGDGEVDTIWTAEAKSTGKVTYEKKPLETEPTTESTTQSEQTNNTDSIVLVSVLAVVAVVFLGGVTAITVVVAGSKKKKPEEIFEVEDKRMTSQDKKEDKWARSQQTEDAPPDVGVIEILKGSMRGFAVPIRNGETLCLGKDPKLCQVVFSGDYEKVSRMHCTITYDAATKHYYVVDCSSNGTFLAGKARLEKGKRTLVTPKTVITLANDSCTILLG